MKHQFSKKLFLLLFTFVAAGNLFAQTSTRGTDFWVSFGNNLFGAVSVVNLELKIVAFEDATVTLTFTETGAYSTFFVAAGNVYSYILDESQGEKSMVYNNSPSSSVQSGSTVSSRSLHITSTGIISAYALNQRSACTDATNLLPVTIWGKDYYQISTYPCDDAGADGYTIIAAEDGTNIEVDGSLVTTLNTGEVYAVYAKLTDFTGKHITSDKNIAFFVTSLGVRIPRGGGARDILFQQLPPVNQWGRKFLVPCTQQQVGRVRVMVSIDGTNIQQTGATVITIDGGVSNGGQASLSGLQAGQFVELEIGAEGCYIAANNPVGVCAFLVGNEYVSYTTYPNAQDRGDPAMTWIAPIEQNMRNILIAPFMPASGTNLHTHHALIVTPTATKDQTSVSIGGATANNITGVTWIDNATCGYSFCSYRLASNTSYLFDNPKGLTVSGYGIGNIESYYFMSGSASRDLSMSYFINGVYYEGIDNAAICEQDVHFEVGRTDFATTPGHAVWILDGNTLEEYEDILAWDVTALPYGDHILTLLVTIQDGMVLPYTLSFTVVPSSVTWTPENNNGSEADKQNWNNVSNWTPGALPDSCTDVHIPGGKQYYPVLNALTPFKSNNIYFGHGSEILRTDLLSYSKAHVDLKVLANRWYMFSPPLLDMYSGDFYKTDPDPAKDEQTAYTMLFNAENPETGVGEVTVEGEWTGAFNTPNVPLIPGSGLALWIDDGKNYGDYDDITFHFPKNDVNHYTYNPDRFPPGNISGTFPTPRPDNGHFAHERSNDGNVILQDVLGHTDGEILVGNPFMAHLDFSDLYDGNPGVLAGNGYKLASGVATVNGSIKDFYSYMKSGDEYVSTNLDQDNDSRSGLIPPMQAFVISVNDGQTVTARIADHTKISTAANDAFRAASQETAGLRSLLNIIATRGEDASKAIILQNETAVASYAPSEDSYKLFISKMMDSDEVLKHIQVYTRSSDGYALDINSIGKSEQDITVPLGIRTSGKGKITLNFSGMESFGEETGIYLYDTQYPKRLIDLSTQPEYAFDKTEDTLYLENRLSLIIGKNTLARPMGFSNVSGISAARIISRPHGTLRIVSENGEALGAVRITDSWGRTLADIPAVSSSVYEYQTPTPGIYIVRVGAKVKKVVSIQ